MTHLNILLFEYWVTSFLCVCVCHIFIYIFSLHYIFTAYLHTHTHTCTHFPLGFLSEAQDCKLAFNTLFSWPDLHFFSQTPPTSSPVSYFSSLFGPSLPSFSLPPLDTLQWVRLPRRLFPLICPDCHFVLPFTTALSRNLGWFTQQWEPVSLRPLLLKTQTVFDISLSNNQALLRHRETQKHTSPD